MVHYYDQYMQVVTLKILATLINTIVGGKFFYTKEKDPRKKGNQERDGIPFLPKSMEDLQEFGIEAKREEKSGK